MKDEFIRIRIEEKDKKTLQEMAEKDHRSLSDYVRIQLMKLIVKFNKKNEK